MNETQKARETETVTLKGQGAFRTVTVRDGAIILPKDISILQHPGKPYRRGARGKTARASKQPKTVAIKDTTGYAPNTVAERLVKTLGSNTVATLLGVSVDRPGRWVSGAEEPGRENRTALTNLDSLVGHLLTAFTPEQVPLWLNGQDPYLGARPIDVFRIDGAAPVIEAIEAFEQGAFA